MPHHVSVILPINSWHDRTDAAIASVVDQDGCRVELLLVLNGCDPELDHRAAVVDAGSAELRVLRAERESLPVALNLGLRQASNDLVARMDADDLSHPGRLLAQADYLDRHPGLAGCGCGTRFVKPGGELVHIVTPPVAPEAARWRLLVSNAFAHGSMMLRRRIVLDQGGYDESRDRAQDYELWLRLAPIGLGGIPDVLYTYYMRAGDTGANGTHSWNLDATQADATAELLLRAWEGLPPGNGEAVRPLMAALAAGDVSGRSRLEALMERDGPSREALTAWLWSCYSQPIRRTDTADRLRRVRSAADRFAAMGTESVWLWGAGDLARFVVGSGVLRVRGLVDDHRAGQSIAGYVVAAPDSVPADACVLITSELYEDAIWHKSEVLRRRGVRVVRLSEIGR